MDKYNSDIYELFREYSEEIHRIYNEEEKSENQYKEFQAIDSGNLLKFDKELMSELQTNMTKDFQKYVNIVLDTQENIGNPTKDISIDRESSAQLSARVLDLLKADYDFVEEIFLNQNDFINGGDLIFAMLMSFLNALVLQELFVNRRPYYEINIYSTIRE